MADGSTEETSPTGAIPPPGAVPAGAAAPVPAARRSSRRRLVPLALVGAMSLGAAAGAAIGVVGSPTIPGVGQSPIAFVISSANATAAQRTADITFSGTLRGPGGSVPLTGTGQADFTKNAFSGAVQFSSHGDSVVERELGVGHAFYLSIAVDGVNTSQYLSGKHWVRVPQPTSGLTSSVGFGNVDPLTQFKILKEHGIAVNLLGTSVIKGDTVSGYSLRETQQQMQRNIEEEINSGQIPASFAAAAEKEVRSLGRPITNYYFDSAGLLRRETMVIGGGTSGVHGRVNVTFDHFGTNISIAVPPPSDILSFSAFLKDASNLSNSQ